MQQETMPKPVVEVMDLTLVCQSFPRLPESMIRRDNIIDTIERMFDGDIELVVVEGGEGMGKTTLLAQFVLRHPNHAFSVFLKPASKLGYDPSSVRYDLCSQLLWVLQPGKECEPEEADEGYLRNLLLRLRKRARRDTYYFVLDGLADIPDDSIRNVILETLPFEQGFRFLLSGDLHLLPPHIRNQIQCKTWQVINFSLDETLKYLGDLRLEQNLGEELYQACGRGMPGHLASVRRSIVNGRDPRTLVKDKFTDLLEEEWKQVSDDEIVLQALALIAHAEHRQTVNDIARLLGKDEEQMEKTITKLSFLEVDDRTSEVSFVAESFRKFAASKLRDQSESVIDLIITDLMARKESEAAINTLPIYFEQRGRLREVLDYLSPEYFAKVIAHNRSLAPVRQKAELGISTAMRLRQDGELMRLSMQKSAIAELEKAEVWRSEIEALMALNDYAGAMNLAQSMLLKEDRLHLLAVIAKFRREQGQPVEDELLQQIHMLCDQVNPIDLGERTIDIASDLLSSCPALATTLIERMTWTETGENALDLAYTKLSIATLLGHKGMAESHNEIETLRARIKDPKLQGITAAISVVAGKQNAHEVIAEVKKMEMTEERLRFLRLWTTENKERSDAAEVSEYALDLMIKTAAYAPNIRVLRELAMPLPFLNDNERARRLVGILDSQKNTVEHVGPTEDFVRLQLLLAQAEKTYDREACRNRLVETYLYVQGLDDLAVKASCLAWLLDTVTTVDSDGDLDAKDQIRPLTVKDLDTITDELLRSTAKHYHVTRSIVKALALSNPQMALKLAGSLNTQDRRDDAMIDLVDSMLKTKLERLDWSLLERILNLFVDDDTRDKGIIKIIEKVSSQSTCPALILRRIIPFINRLHEIGSASRRCPAYCLAHRLLSNSDETNEYDSLRSHLLSLLDASWQDIDVGWIKVDTGFQIVRSLAEHDPTLARQYLTRTEQARKEIGFNADAPAWTYRSCLRLAVRAFAGLLPRTIDTEKDYKRLRDLIDYLPSRGERAKIWAELALRCFTARRSDEGQRIVMEHVKPLLRALPETDLAYRVDITVSLAPALYKTHPSTAKELLQKLPQSAKDEAFDLIAEFMLRKRSPSDPYEDGGQGYDVNYETIVEIIEIINEIKRDSYVYGLIEAIAETVASNRYRDRFTLQQRVEVANRLKTIVSSKFPDPDNIRHDGYKIAADAQIARLSRTGPQDWEALLNRARTIPNRSDSAFVLAIVGGAMPNREIERRARAFREAIDVAKFIPSFLDRTERLVDLASIMMNIEPSFAKDCLKSTMESVIDREAISFRRIQRRIIDLAFKLDPELASSLASLSPSTDTDPARKHAREELKIRLETLNLKKQIVNEASFDNKQLTQHKGEFPRAAWLALGSLNAGRMTNVHIEQTRDPIVAASNYPLSEAYPILVWVIENAVQRLSNTDQAMTTLRQVFDATLLAAEIYARMSTRFSDQLQRAKDRIVRENEKEPMLVSAGDREKAIRALQDWFVHDVKDYLKICDQFFGPLDLELLMLIHSANPKCKVYILTSKKHQDNEKVFSPQTEYLEYWRRISDQDPPETDIVIVGIESSGKSPIHDRWWITDGGGLKLGTSFNSLGTTQDSTISRISEVEAKSLEDDINQYLIDKKREYNGEKLRYVSITL